MGSTEEWRRQGKKSVNWKIEQQRLNNLNRENRQQEGKKESKMEGRKERRKKEKSKSQKYVGP